MKITSVGVRKLVTMEGYNNHAVEAQAIVEDGEDAETVLENLTVWVDDRISYERSQRKLFGRGEYLAIRVAGLERREKELLAKIETGQAIIMKHEKLRDLAVENKISVPGLNHLGDDLPF